jgi:nicotinamidase-related amidase
MFFQKPAVDLLGKMPFALVIVDMQEYFFEAYRDAGVYSRIKKLIKNQIKLIEFANLVKMPVIFIEHRFATHYRNGPTIFHERRPTVGSLFDSARYRLLIERNHDDGFLTTYRESCSGLDPLLKRVNAKGIILSGINSFSCVSFTASAASRRGYSLIMSDDLIADYRRFYETQESHFTKVDFMGYTKGAIFFKKHKSLLNSLRKAYKDRGS